MVVVIEGGNGRLINWNVMCLQGKEKGTDGGWGHGFGGLR
jgi:hypothetical protein